MGGGGGGGRSICVKIGELLSHVTLKFDDWSWKKKKKAHLFHDTSGFLYLFLAICEFTVALWSGKDQTGAKFDLDLELRPLTLSFCMDITPDIGNYSWKFDKYGRCDRRTDISTHKQTEGQNLS